MLPTARCECKMDIFKISWLGDLIYSVTVKYLAGGIEINIFSSISIKKIIDMSSKINFSELWKKYPKFSS